MASKKIIVANWKMNPSSLSKAKEIFGGVQKFNKKNSLTVVICPPFPFLGVLSAKNNIAIGAQNIFGEYEGAFTGEVSAPMLVSLKVSYVILGHSERRKLGETNESVSKKVAVSLKAGLRPIVCIGEKERDVEGHFFNTIKTEILDTLSLVSKKQISKLVLAYEPVWAISTEGKGAMAPADIHETVIFIKKVLTDKYGKEAKNVKILYGGSIDQNNTKGVLEEGGSDGLLVGKASLKPEIFGKILAAAQ